MHAADEGRGPARVVVAGATGLLGRHLCRALPDLGHTVTALVRDEGRARALLPDTVEVMAWNAGHEQAWRSRLSGADAVVNLAGAPLDARRWNDEYRQLLRTSRVDTTRRLVNALLEGAPRGKVLLNASAVGIYGDRGDEILTEDSERGRGFLADLCADWEAEAEKAQAAGVRVVLLRTGLVLTPEAGMLARMLPFFRMGVGGPIGNGRQWLPWIHIEDHVRMMCWALQTLDVSGPVNLTAPQPVQMRDFARMLGSVVKRPALFPVPRTVLSLMLGEMAEVVTASQRALPDVAARRGFEWHYPRLDEALRSLLS